MGLEDIMRKEAMNQQIGEKFGIMKDLNGVISTKNTKIKQFEEFKREVPNKKQNVFEWRNRQTLDGEVRSGKPGYN